MMQKKIRHLVEKTMRNGQTLRYWQPGAPLRKAGFLPERLPKEIGAAIARAEELNKSVDAFYAGEPRIARRLGLRPAPRSIKFNNPKPPSKRGRPVSELERATGFSGIYVVGDGELIKIGIAADPVQRIASLQAGNGRKLGLVLFLPVPSDRVEKVESAAHKKLAAHRGQGEWFTINRHDACRLVVGAYNEHGRFTELKWSVDDSWNIDAEQSAERADLEDGGPGRN